MYINEHNSTNTNTNTTTTNSHSFILPAVPPNSLRIPVIDLPSEASHPLSDSDSASDVSDSDHQMMDQLDEVNVANDVSNVYIPTVNVIVPEMRVQSADDDIFMYEEHQTLGHVTDGPYATQNQTFQKPHHTQPQLHQRKGSLTLSIPSIQSYHQNHLQYHQHDHPIAAENLLLSPVLTVSPPPPTPSTSFTHASLGNNLDQHMSSLMKRSSSFCQFCQRNNDNSQPVENFVNVQSGSEIRDVSNCTQHSHIDSSIATFGSGVLSAAHVHIQDDDPKNVLLSDAVCSSELKKRLKLVCEEISVGDDGDADVDMAA
jgi:hypothetical protein